MNHRAFFDAIRDHVALTHDNVPGFDRVLDYGEARRTPLNQLAYIIATAYWETNKTMRPVTEAYWLSEEWRKRNLRYYPWHGRGLIQTTWRENYEKMSEVVGADLIADPDLLLQWKYALPALFVGMERGLYTGKSLDDYIDDLDEPDSEDLREYIAARRIVNGTDKASSIGKLALHFERGLKAAEYDATGATQPVIPPPPDIPTPKPEPPPTRPVGWFWPIVFAAALMAAFLLFAN